MSMDTLKSNTEYKKEDFDKQLFPLPKHRTELQRDILYFGEDAPGSSRLKQTQQHLQVLCNMFT